MPGVQKPHWLACASVKRSWIGCAAPGARVLPSPVHSRSLDELIILR
jgi:hypothetical protein